MQGDGDRPVSAQALDHQSLGDQQRKWLGQAPPSMVFEALQRDFYGPLVRDC
jgi:hypothetical protein